MLLTERSIWTMVHGIGLGGSALLALAAALFAIYLVGRRNGNGVLAGAVGGPFAGVTAFAALMLWLTAVVGTYVIFPPYRAAAPEGTTLPAQYPRSMLLADPETAWLHSFAMETKEHLPWTAAMLATAVAFVAWRYRDQLLTDAPIRRLGGVLLAICFAAVSYISLLGVFVNKVAPLH
ncbi:MAG: hypothetical protein WD737_07300 [Gemmatimonadota bacterium]